MIRRNKMKRRKIRKIGNERNENDVKDGNEDHLERSNISGIFLYE